MTAMRRARVALLLLLALASAGPTPAQPEGIDVLLERVEASLTGGDKQAFVALTRIPAGDETFRVFLDRWFVTATTRATVHERDRVERGGPNALRLIVEVLVETGRQGRLATWRLDLDRDATGWRIVAATTLSVVEGLFRLTLDETAQYRARNLRRQRRGPGAAARRRRRVFRKCPVRGHGGGAAGQRRDDLFAGPGRRAAPDRPADRRTVAAPVV